VRGPGGIATLLAGDRRAALALDHGAKVTIDDPAIVAGELPSGVFRKVRRWAIADHAFLVEGWNAYN